MMAEKHDSKRESSRGISAFCFYPKQLINQSIHVPESHHQHADGRTVENPICFRLRTLVHTRHVLNMIGQLLECLYGSWPHSVTHTHTRDIKKGITRTKPNPGSHSFERYQPMPHPAGILCNFPHGGVLKRLLPHPCVKPAGSRQHSAKRSQRRFWCRHAALCRSGRE